MAGNLTVIFAFLELSFVCHRFRANIVHTAFIRAQRGGFLHNDNEVSSLALENSAALTGLGDFVDG